MENFNLIFNIFVLMAGIYMFLLAFKLYEPKHKTEEQKERFLEWHRKFGTFLKIASIVTIITALVRVLGGVSDKEQNKTEDQHWTEKQIEIMVKECIKKEKNDGTYYPILTEEYCSCTFRRMTDSLTIDRYLELQNNPSKEEWRKVVLPIVQDCIDNYNNGIEMIKKDTSSAK